MEKNEYRKHFELEDSFWWFVGRRKIILSMLNSFKIRDFRLDLLDIGCGTGYNLKFFQTFSDPFGCELSEEALSYCKKRELKKIARADAEMLPFRNSSFDLVTLLDVLYHKNVTSDIKVLHEVYRVLKKDGYLLITDSAFNFLRSRHDIAFHSRERYDKKTLKERLKKANFSIEKLTYFNFFLFFAVVFIRFLEKRGRGEKRNVESDLKAVYPALNALLLSILRLEAVLIKRVDFPFGSSILCLAKKEE